MPAHGVDARAGLGCGAAPAARPAPAAPIGAPSGRCRRPTVDRRPDRAARRRRRAPARPAAAAPIDPAERAREICLRLLAFRPRTRAELATALRQRGHRRRGRRRGARPLRRGRHHRRPGVRPRLGDQPAPRPGTGPAGAGRRAAAQGRGAPRRSGRPWTSSTRRPRRETARALVDRKLRGDAGRPPDAVFRRLVGMLARKGYPAGLAVRVVKDALADAPTPRPLEAAELGGRVRPGPARRSPPRRDRSRGHAAQPGSRGRASVIQGECHQTTCRHARDHGPGGHGKPRAGPDREAVRIRATMAETENLSCK